MPLINSVPRGSQEVWGDGEGWEGVPKYFVSFFPLNFSESLSHLEKEGRNKSTALTLSSPESGRLFGVSPFPANCREASSVHTDSVNSLSVHSPPCSGPPAVLSWKDSQ